MESLVVMQILGESQEAVEAALAKLGVKLVYKRLSDRGARLIKYTNGDRELVIDKRIKPGTPEWEHNIWHELGHLVDDARSYGGRSSYGSSLQTGKYSTPSGALLQKFRDYLKNGRKIDLVYSVSFDGKTYPYDKFMALPDEGNDKLKYFKTSVRTKYERALRQMEKYMNQNIELFADGYSRFKREPEKMKAEAPDLYNMYASVD